MAKEWYRRETWSIEDELDFYAHLRRARTSRNKAQYLRVQCVHLKQPDKPDLVRAGLRLVQQCVTEFPEEKSEIAISYCLMAECYSILNERENAIDAYLKCFDAQRRCPNYLTGAPNSFALFVIQHNLQDQFELAASVLIEFNVHMIMPLEIYEHYGCLAIFAQKEGLQIEAKTFAQLALDAASRVHSGLWKHPKLGLVKDPESDFHKRIELIFNS